MAILGDLLDVISFSADLLDDLSFDLTFIQHLSNLDREHEQVTF
jgi:hypothetical protein